MREITLENVKVRDLPQAWAEHTGGRPEDLVHVTIRTVNEIKNKGIVNRNEIKEFLDQLETLPVLDNRTSEEILGYNEFGLSS